jgi:hypothetical protein
MCALLAIVQYEVHYFQEGRWLVQSRYPGDQRQDAINDASVTEAQTRRPTKVIKDTYLPHENRNETVTVYIGPLLKAAMDKAKVQTVAQRPSMLYTPTRHAKTQNAHHAVAKGRTAPRRKLNLPGDLLWRALIAVGLSLAAATVVTLMLSWMLRHSSDFGIVISPDREGAILTMTYVGVFFLGLFSLFRFGAPIKRLIAALWQSTQSASDQPRTGPLAKFADFRLRQKRAAQKPFEQAQEIVDMKRLRGDLDAPGKVKEAEAESANRDADMPTALELPTQPAPQAPEPSLIPTIEPPKALDNASFEDASFEAQQFTAAPTAPVTAAPAAATHVAQAPHAFDPAINELQRAMALRFVAEVVLPHMTRDHDDPVARRGAALFITGATRHLAASSGISGALADNLMAGSVKAAVPQHAYDAFMDHFIEHVEAPMNAPMISAGHAAMMKFLTGQRDLDALSASMQAWRIGLPTLPKAEAAGHDRTTPSDYYLLTDVRGADAFLMDFHNHAVRLAVENNDGIEIKHTGRGILARFAYADFAIQAAMSVAAKLNGAVATTEANFAVALVPGYGAADDPVLSPKVAKQAQALIERAPRASVVCDIAIFNQAHAKTRYQAQNLGPNTVLVREKPPLGVVETQA